jgi:hypothetical protein
VAAHRPHRHDAAYASQIRRLDAEITGTLENSQQADAPKPVRNGSLTVLLLRRNRDERYSRYLWAYKSLWVDL